MENTTYRQKLMDKNYRYVQCYDAFFWKFSSKPNKARLLSILIDYDNYAESKYRRNSSGYFLCTSSYINYRLYISNHAAGKLVKELEAEGYIKTYIHNQQRYIKLNEKNINSIFKDFSDYLIEETIECWETNGYNTSPSDAFNNIGNRWEPNNFEEANHMRMAM